MATVKLVIVRHGETAWTRERRFSGGRDIPLAPAGEVQAEAVARALASQTLAAVYSSPLERARMTAEIVAKPHRLAVKVDPRLVEMGFGAWEGLGRADVAARDPGGWRTWQEAPQSLTSHGGEPPPAVAARVTALVEELRAAHDGETLVLVTHAIVIRLVVLGALGLGPEQLWSVDASPAGITEIELASDWSTVHRMNTLAHLGGSP